MNVNQSSAASPAAYDPKYKLYHLSAPDKDYDKVSSVTQPGAKQANNGAGSAVSEAVKSVSNELKKSADAISAKFPPLFERLTASVKDNKALEVTGVNSALAKDENTDVSVTQTARSQRSSGYRLSPDAEDFGAESARFEIETNERSYKINVNISEGDTNRDVQNKTADAINKRDTGVRAAVYENRKSGKSFIELSSENTGAASAFSVRDAQGGDFVKKLGADRRTQQARDAVYSVNGSEDKTSPSNDVYIGNGISARLKESTGDESVKISLRQDTETIKSKINEFVDSFNDFVNNETLSAPKNEKIIDGLKSAFNSYSAKLNEGGISYSKNRLAADEGKLTQTIISGNDDFKKALGAASDSPEGFANKASRLARHTHASAVKYDSAQSYAEAALVNSGPVTGEGDLYDSVG